MTKQRHPAQVKGPVCEKSFLHLVDACSPLNTETRLQIVRPICSRQLAALMINTVNYR